MRAYPYLLRTGIFAVLLAAASVARAATPSSAELWLNNYYQQPAPERFTSAVFELSRSGYFEQPHHVPLAIGFLGSIFAQHPDRVDEWMRVSPRLPVAHQRILASALWYSGNPKGVTYLQALARSANPELRHEIEGLVARTPDLKSAEVKSVRSLDLQWGVFLATGEKAPVQNILAALGTDNNAKFSQDVRWSVAQNAAQHPRVLAICRDELSRQPNAIRETLRAVINDTEQRHQPST
ncbi:MAG: hypothetical protein ABIZ04_21335 [Opitutus sp.]